MDGQLPGEQIRGKEDSRRNTQDKSNFFHFFAIGTRARYPNLDEKTLFKAIKSPLTLMQDGFLQPMQFTNVHLRPDLTRLVLDCVLPNHDLSDLVKEIHGVMQHNRSIC